tara:strand:- start:3788 stop:4066 length:279 start_codon:yes stop_codon:yes gene_type:complete
MSMPKGIKIERGYATVTDLSGMDYRSIAEKMTEEGFKMNHATARNVFVKGLSKIAREVCVLYGQDCSPENLKNVAINPAFQNAIAEMITEID